jgi:hypothetical protein
MRYKMILSMGDKVVHEYVSEVIDNNDFTTASQVAVMKLFTEPDADNVTCYRVFGESVAEDNFFYAEKG